MLIKITETSFSNGGIDNKAKKIFKSRIIKQREKWSTGDWKTKNIDVIEISGIEELINKLKEYGGEFVISAEESICNTDPKLPILEIYDYYRE